MSLTVQSQGRQKRGKQGKGGNVPDLAKAFPMHVPVDCKHCTIYQHGVYTIEYDTYVLS